MTPEASNPAFQCRRIAALLQHLQVMVALQNQATATAQHVHHVRGNMSRVGEHAEPPHAIGKHKLHRFTRIVRDGKRLDTNIANRERFVAVDDRYFDLVAHLARCSQRTVSKHYGPTETPRTGKHATDVIGMLMRNQHGIDLVRCDADPFQPSRYFARTESRIDQQAGSAGLDQQGVTPAAAAE